MNNQDGSDTSLFWSFGFIKVSNEDISSLNFHCVSPHYVSQTMECLAINMNLCFYLSLITRSNWECYHTRLSYLSREFHPYVVSHVIDVRVYHYTFCIVIADNCKVILVCGVIRYNKRSRRTSHQLVFKRTYMIASI